MNPTAPKCELLPCPFCGGQPLVETIPCDDLMDDFAEPETGVKIANVVVCSTCGAQSDAKPKHMTGAAETAWNTRAPASSVSEPVADSLACWLIERNNPTEWLVAPEFSAGAMDIDSPASAEIWSSDPMRALRFDSKEMAEHKIKLFETKGIATEHIFVSSQASRSHAAPQEAVDAARFRALIRCDKLIYPCRPPLMDGGWNATMRGDWGTCGVTAKTLTELADRLIVAWAEKEKQT